LLPQPAEVRLRVPVARFAGLLPLLLAALLCAMCSSHPAGPVRQSGVVMAFATSTPTSTPTPIPNRPPVVQLESPAVADQGYVSTTAGSFNDPDDTAWTATVDYGDGSGTRPVEIRPDNTFVLHHNYVHAGSFPATVTVVDAHGLAGATSTTVNVAARKVIFIQGIESESRCPDGAGFDSRAPAWVGSYLAEDPEMQSSLAIDAGSLIKFSYSGNYCGGDGAHGEPANYRNGDTCNGITGPNGSAAKLRALIERLAPSRVTILGHSMGGLIAAYLAGEDPAWAAQHIASIVAFDSPLGGVPGLNLGVLRISGALSGGCAMDSASEKDMEDGDTPILRTARAGAQAVPIYTLDATEKEGFVVGIRQAVPGPNAHIAGEVIGWSIAANHSALWDTAPRGPIRGEDKRLMVGCAILRLTASECEAPGGAPLLSPG
jgi:pimeloyl-ACP methyl ester carboxylesterase